MSRRECVDLEVLIVHATADAVCVAEDDEGEGVWLPKEAIEEMVPDDARTGDRCTITITEELATKKGLV